MTMIRFPFILTQKHSIAIRYKYVFIFLTGNHENDESVQITKFMGPTWVPPLSITSWEILQIWLLISHGQDHDSIWHSAMKLPWTLTHWGRVTHLCVSKLTIIVPDNGLSPDRRQAIIWTNVGILLIRTLGTDVSEILSEIHIFPFKKMHLKMSSAKWRPFCLGLNVLTQS